MARPDDSKDFVEFSRPRGHLVARIVVPSMGQNEAPRIREQVMAELSSAGTGRLFVLDFSQVSLVSSMGLGTCVDLRNAAEKAGMRPIACGMNRHLVELFALMRIDRLFTIARTPQELDALLGG